MNISTIFTRVVDIIFPRICSGCGDTGTFLCAECLARIPRADQPKESFISAIFDYQNKTIRNVIWKFKYRNARSIAEHFGGVLYDEIIGDLSDDLRIGANETFLLVPIPLYKKRLHTRGYNQSELLAREIIKCDTGQTFFLTPYALTRVRATTPQAKSQKRVARFENLRGAFEARPELVRGKHIILIDDVTTTGATLSEARKALLKAGAKSVRAYTVAH